jgi:hypothetical protein
LFTDQPVTPLRLETLLEVVRTNSGVERDELKALLQPASIRGDGKAVQATATLAAANELGLVQADARGHLRLTSKGAAPVRTLVLAALDREVLSKEEVEPYLARFYAFMSGAPDRRSNAEWVATFNNAVYGAVRVADPFNPTKLSGLWRWLPYAGLGWMDPGDQFQPCPYERIRRQLPAIFASERKLEDEDFMERLAACCPELDGGKIFLGVHAGSEREAQRCTPGLAAALVELHLDGVLRLHAPPDVHGWNIAAAEPVSDGKTLTGQRLQYVELVQGAGRGNRDA